MPLNTIENIALLKGKRVLLRVDFNVPLSKNGEIEDDTRIVEALPTIKFLIEKGARIIVVTHLGRPDGKVVESLRLDNVTLRLQELLGKNVVKVDEILGEKVESAIASMSDGDVLMLENIRFSPGEELNDDIFSKELADLADVFVSDGFGVVHRKHASVYGVTKYLPSFAGFLIEKEVTNLKPIVDGDYKAPLCLIFGGAKIETKIRLMEKFVGVADYFLVGGGLANTFLAALGKDVGSSLYEKNEMGTALRVIEACKKSKTELVLPVDYAVAEELKSGVEVEYVGEDGVNGRKILDIGPGTIDLFSEFVAYSKTIVWNGPLGVSEYEEFIKGSCGVMEEMANSDGRTVIGGGDTVDCMVKCGFESSDFTHVSTGGGACLDYLSGDVLPGITVLYS